MVQRINHAGADPLQVPEVYQHPMLVEAFPRHNDDNAVVVAM
jgi:hypothetical protein